MQAVSLINDFPAPTDQDIDAVMADNLCRCMTYVRIRNAIKQAAAQSGRLLPMSELEHIRARFRAAPLPSRDVVPNSGFEGTRPRLLRGAFSRRETEREPGTTVVAPAIGNAIFAAVGVRLRHLPIRPAAVLQALTSQRRSTDTFPCGHQTNFERVMEATGRSGYDQHTS
jgi:xanthine dehydrogenase iron-sulfur cluster and FAD-binding subunit A